MLKVKTLVLNPSNSTEIPSESTASKTGGAKDEKSPVVLPSQTGLKPVELPRSHVTVANDSPLLPIAPSIAPETVSYTHLTLPTILLV